ncbi:hypothetical protein J2I48_05700 [Fibrella sp. HMF5036]|uniref:Uncharacterized protein n=2 Tax=Fibrella aquatilis TaxID=2817059 RepID=A0A939G135_9BACT|nr:hypothetical protein [Fibrella aquatilis]
MLVAMTLGITMAFAQTDTTTTKQTGAKKKAKATGVATVRPLFAADEPLSFTLSAQMQRIVRDRTKPSPKAPVTRHPARLTYSATPSDSIVALPLDLVVRGNFRRDAANCVFPPLYVDFPKKAVKGTLFAKQNKLKLVTHCREDEYVLREYLVYRLYNQLTDLSFKARLAQVTYLDSAGKRKPETHLGILLEDEDDVASRNNVAVYKNRVKSAFVDSLNMATISVFEYMIGNTDWSVVYRHNIKMVLDSTMPRPLAVPYDFDHAGLVDARYAKPAEQLSIESVRERLYRGPAYPQAMLNRVFARFRALKPTFYAFYQNEKRLSPSYIRDTIYYLDAFYKTIDNPEKARAAFQSDLDRSIQVRGMNNN